jgi:hypothetical protein
VVLLVDDSASLTVAETPGGRPRAEAVRDALGRDASQPPAWMDALAALFRVRLHTADSHLRAVADFSGLSFQGTASRLERALQTLIGSGPGSRVAALVVVTDGCPTDAGHLKLEAGSVKVPIFPVLVGEEAPRPNLRLVEHSVAQTAFEDTPVTITAGMEATGFQGREAEVQVLDSAGKLVVAEKVRLGKAAEAQTLRLKLPAAKPGVSFYRLVLREAGLAGQDGQGDWRAASQEATLADNERQVMVDRGRGPYRVLYVAGRPNWEHKFMRRALAEDLEVQVPSLIRIAKREPKFEWRGRTGESSNPLFRGFGDQAEAQRYDQPVLIRLGTKDARELRDGFPKTAEELFADYRAIILDDIEAEFFTQEQMSLMERFVSERGGALLTLGGQESYQHGGYEHTPLGRMMPVYLDRTSTAPAVENARLDLTREGWLEAWTRLRPERAAEEQRLAQMPGFYAVNQVFSIKPGASVLATLSTGGDEPTSWPALVTQRFGEGRVLSVLIADLWRWGMRDEESRKDFDKAWRQLMRALIVDVPDQMQISVQPGLDAVKVETRLRDAAFQPQDDAQVRLEVTAPDGSKSPLFPEPSLQEPGLFEAEYFPRLPGAYLVEATASPVNASPEPSQQEASPRAETDPSPPLTRRTGWVHDPLAAEFANLAPGRDWAERLAAASGGRVLTLADLPRLPELLRDVRAPVEETLTTPLWHTPWMFAALITLLAAEWFLRRKGGLA